MKVTVANPRHPALTKQDRPEALSEAIRAAIGKRFRAELERCGLTGAALGRELGVSRASVNHWLTGRAMPEAAQLWRIAQMFDISVDYILTGRVEQSPDVIGLARRLAAMPPGQRKALTDLFGIPAPDHKVAAAFGKPR